MSRIADDDRAKGAEEVFSDRRIPAFLSAQINTEQVPANDGAVGGFKAPDKIPGEIIGFEASLFFTCGVLDREAQDQNSAGHCAAVPPHAHAGAEGAAQPEGCVPIQTQLPAEPGKDGLRSRVPLIEK